MAQNVALPVRDTWQNVALVDRSAAATAPTITTTALPDGVLDTVYSQTIQKTGSDPITFAVQSGTLPAGLTLNTTTGVISGTPTTPVLASGEGEANKATKLPPTRPTTRTPIRKIRP